VSSKQQVLRKLQSPVVCFTCEVWKHPACLMRHIPRSGKKKVSERNNVSCLCVCLSTTDKLLVCLLFRVARVGWSHVVLTVLLSLLSFSSLDIFSGFLRRTEIENRTAGSIATNNEISQETEDSWTPLFMNIHCYPRRAKSCLQSSSLAQIEIIIRR